MSILSKISNPTYNPKISLGQGVYVLVGDFRNNTGGTQPETIGDFVITGKPLLKSSYSSLYGLIGDALPDLTGVTTGTSSTINSATFGNSTYVYVGTGGALATSTNGNTWTARTSGITAEIKSVLFANNLFIYGGLSGNLRTSTDAITWTARTSGIANGILSFTYATGIYVFAGQSGAIRTSTDAITWTARTSGTAQDIQSIGYLNNQFIYVGNAGVIGTSTDAITWTARTSGTAQNINGIDYASGIYLYVGNSGACGSSTDGITWTTRTSLVTLSIRGIAAINGWFLVEGNLGNSSINGLQYTKDGITWSSWVGRPSVLNYQNTSAINYVNGFIFLLGGNGTMFKNAYDLQQNFEVSYKSMPLNFETTALGATNNSIQYYVKYVNSARSSYPLGSIIYDYVSNKELTNSREFVRPGYIYNTSLYPDLKGQIGSFGASGWTIGSSGTTSTLTEVFFSPTTSLFVFGGTGGVLSTSTDAITWTPRTSGTTQQISIINYVNGAYIYGGTNGVLATSTDAITWTARTSGTTQNITSITYGAGVYAYAGTNGALASSTDAITWTARSVPGLTMSLYSFNVAFGNGLFIFNGNSGLYGSSTDGTTWTYISNYASGAAHYRLVYQNGLFISTYSSSRIAYSTTGTSGWTLVGGISANNVFNSAIAFGNGTYVYTGNWATAATSTNLTTWKDVGSNFTKSSSNYIYGVAYGAGKFVYVGSGGILATSPDPNTVSTCDFYDINTQFTIPALRINNATKNQLFVKARP